MIVTFSGLASVMMLCLRVCSNNDSDILRSGVSFAVPVRQIFSKKQHIISRADLLLLLYTCNLVKLL